MLPLIPITALVIQNSVTMNSLMGYQARVSMVRKQVRLCTALCTVTVMCTVQVRGAMEIALFIQNIQEERAEVALYIFTNQSNVATDTQREINRKVCGIQIEQIYLFKYAKLFSINFRIWNEI